MRITVTAKPGAKAQKIERIDERHFVVAVTVPPVQGKANRAVIDVLADYFRVPRSRIRIVAGATGRKKIVEIEE